MRYLIGLILIFCLVLFSAACSGPGSSSTAQPTASAAGLTFGQLSDAGKTVYANNCASCHGENGQGVKAPAIIGASARLQKYNNAQRLFDYIHTNMPGGAAGSLPLEQYQQVLGFLLVQNNFVSSGMAFDPKQLSNIQLK